MQTIIRVRAFPDAKKEYIEETEPHILRVFVREPAKDNRANRKILDLVADFYTIPRNKLRMISGHHGMSKMIEVLH